MFCFSQSNELINIEDWKHTEKGKEFLTNLEIQLEEEFKHDMITKPEFKPGIENYLRQKYSIPGDTSIAPNTAHNHIILTVSEANFENLPNETLIDMLTDFSAESFKEWFDIVRPNKFLVEMYENGNTLYIAMALDRPFNYDTWKAED